MCSRMSVDLGMERVRRMRANMGVWGSLGVFVSIEF